MNFYKLNTSYNRLPDKKENLLLGPQASSCCHETPAILHSNQHPDFWEQRRVVSTLNEEIQHLSFAAMISFPIQCICQIETYCCKWNLLKT